TVYMHQPPEFWDPAHPDYVCLLQRSLYGLKQTPRAWFQRFVSYITRVGFHHSRCDSSLVIYKHGMDTAYLLLYMDDIVLTASSQALLQQIIRSLHQEFSMTDLGSLNYFLSISVTQDSSRMFLSQKKYVVEILKRPHMVNCNPSQTPVDTESKLGPDGDLVSYPTLYRSLAGSLQYLTFTRSDISYAVQQLFSSSTTDVVAFSDADWAVALLLATRLQVIVYFLATTYFLGLLSANRCFLVLVQRPSIMHQRTKHIEIDIHFVRDLIAAGEVRILHVPSRYQYVDIFTKGLPSTIFEEFRTSLSIRCSPAPTAGEVSVVMLMIMKTFQPTSASGKKKQAELTRQEVSNSNPFDALNMVENDDDLGINGGSSKLDEKGVNLHVVFTAHGTSSRPLVVQLIPL
ncbi:ribonuclease H-like domain-containing protein, partial [Tanacetum coccineum]